ALWCQGRGKKRPSELGCGRRTDARLRHGVVTIHSGSYWIINTLEMNVYFYFFMMYNGNSSISKKSFLL
ncbi:hypothetical protein P4S95_21115, partial [Aneurinibacillus aneurinilyticus]|uniref:hypothetical protein n=1 Tax=Aneurinibacillus aneurinilyticus TaxID=1391 RepID=UPI002E1B0FE7|nr:hypothetical protein [Aneurinibacillus aneurinilyticus]